MYKSHALTLNGIMLKIVIVRYFVLKLPFKLVRRKGWLLQSEVYGSSGLSGSRHCLCKKFIIILILILLRGGGKIGNVAQNLVKSAHVRTMNHCFNQPNIPVLYCLIMQIPKVSFQNKKKYSWPIKRLKHRHCPIGPFPNTFKEYFTPVL